jgi:hypothetical protein
MNLLGSYGCSWIRLWFDWLPMEDQPGEIDWAVSDRQVKAVRGAGMWIMPVFNHRYDKKSWRHRSLDRGDFEPWGNFVRAVILRYRDVIDVWEVWNEPGLLPGDGREQQNWYRRLCKLTYAIAHKEDPGCTVVTCSSGDNFQTNGNLGAKYVEPYLKDGGVKYCDAIGLHPYCSVNAPIWQDLQGTIDTLRRWAREAGADKPVIVTEAGPITGSEGYISDSKNLQQASNMVQNWLIARINNTRYFHFEAHPTYRFPWNMFDPEMIPNAVFCGMNVLAEQLKDTRSIERLTLPKSIDGVYGFVLQQPKTSTAVLWCLGFPEHRELLMNLPDGTAVLNMFGNPIALKKQKDKTVIPLSHYPAYLELPKVPPAGVQATVAKAMERPRDHQDARQYLGSVSAGEIWAAGTPKPGGLFAPSKEGFIENWLILGPFANPGERPYGLGRTHDFLACLGGEDQVQLRDGTSVIYAFPTGRKEWPNPPKRRELPAKPTRGKDGKVDLLQTMDVRNYAVAYAYCNVTAAKKTKAKLAVGSDDGIQVWLNGHRVIDADEYRAAERDQNTANVTLRKGVNRLLVKVNQDIGGWGFYLRFLKSNGQPLVNLKVGW